MVARDLGPLLLEEAFAAHPLSKLDTGTFG